jgi:hypothetical protein
MYLTPSAVSLDRLPGVGIQVAGKDTTGCIGIAECRSEQHHARVSGETAVVAHTIEIGERIHDRACPCCVIACAVDIANVPPARVPHAFSLSTARSNTVSERVR